MRAEDSALPMEPALLSVRVDPAGFPFETTQSLEAFSGVLGQERAQAAIEFGVAMQRPGYNLFVMGDAGTGRLSVVTHHLRIRAQNQEAPSDWLYLNNFNEAHRPVALELAAGFGRRLVADFDAFVDNVLATFPIAFENPAFQRGKQAIEQEFNQRYGRAIDEVECRGKENNVALFRDGDVISFAPMLGGEAVSEEEFADFPEEDRDAFHENARHLEKFLNESLMELPLWKRESNDRMRRFYQDTIGQGIDPLLATLAKAYADTPGLLRYLEAVRLDLLRSVADWLSEERPLEARDETSRRTELINRYCPKLLVSHDVAGAPVVYEHNPTYSNLFGRVEYLNEQGALVTHYRLICPGSIHRANGGYLILDADKVVSEPHVWPALKRALKNRQIRIEAPQQDPALPAVVTLNPEEMPLRVKIVLIGEAGIYYLMQALDDEFTELFRVLAEFDDEIPRDDGTMLVLARLLKGHAEASGWKTSSAAAVARLMEVSIRQAGHQARLSARVGDLIELAGEADLIRQQEGDGIVDACHVELALQRREARLGRIGQRLRQEILEGKILIDTAGVAVGKVNGLTVLEVGDSRFGMPARITATLYPGSRGVVDIEGEVLLGQAIHSKGIMILSGYLGHRYARGFPLAISANLAIEQSYGHVDGDSASLAEVCALISALTGIAIRQSLAVTGSINQYGEVQAVGGVNEKVEGFFRLCADRGLDGEHAVIVPKANLSSLMLNGDVVDAARRRVFAVYAVDSVDQALTILTGKPARMVNASAASRLRALSRFASTQGQPR